MANHEKPTATSTGIEPESDHDERRVSVHDLKEKDVFHSDVLVDQDLMNNAFQAENREHQEGVWTAVKSHPMACFWAFIFCFTIVSLRHSAMFPLQY